MIDSRRSFPRYLPEFARYRRVVGRVCFMPFIFTFFFHFPLLSIPFQHVPPSPSQLLLFILRSRAACCLQVTISIGHPFYFGILKQRARSRVSPFARFSLSCHFLDSLFSFFLLFFFFFIFFFPLFFYLRTWPRDAISTGPLTHLAVCVCTRTAKFEFLLLSFSF